MAKAGVITPVTEPTDWLHGLVIVKKPDGTIWICIDPRPVNKVLQRAYFRIPTFEEILPNLAKAILDARKGFWQCELDEDTSAAFTSTARQLVPTAHWPQPILPDSPRQGYF